MPRTPPILILNGEPAYGRFVEDLLAEARRRGLVDDSKSALVEYALGRLGRDLGIAAPRRVRPVGSNQHPTSPAEPKMIRCIAYVHPQAADQPRTITVQATVHPADPHAEG